MAKSVALNIVWVVLLLFGAKLYLECFPKSHDGPETRLCGVEIAKAFGQSATPGASLR